MRKINWNKTFSLGNVYIECGWQNTSYGFRHLAVLREDSTTTRVSAKACYYNRTWESYTYQTVVRCAINKAYPKKGQEEIRKELMARADAIGKGEAGEFFKPFKILAALGEIMGNTPEEKTALKQKALAAVPGIDFPEGFDSLPEEEKAKRINGALGVL